MRDESGDLESLRQQLRARNLRATPARLAVLRTLCVSRSPVSHLEVSERLAGDGFEKSTVFRALSDLTDAGLLRKMELGDHVWRFEVVENDPAAHPHLLCTDCGHIRCLDDDQVQLKVTKTLGPIEDILLRGKCDDCR